MSETVEQVAEEVLWEENCAISVQRLAVGAEIESATFIKTEDCASNKLAPAVGLEPREDLNSNETEVGQKQAKGKQKQTLPSFSTKGQEQKTTSSIHSHDKSAQSERVPEEYENQSLSEDLMRVVAEWDRLPEAVRVGILAMVQAAVKEGEQE
jgi:hypothetical protein